MDDFLVKRLNAGPPSARSARVSPTWQCDSACINLPGRGVVANQ